MVSHITTHECYGGYFRLRYADGYIHLPHLTSIENLLNILATEETLTCIKDIQKDYCVEQKLIRYDFQKNPWFHPDLLVYLLNRTEEFPCSTIASVVTDYKSYLGKRLSSSIHDTVYDTLYEIDSYLSNLETDGYFDNITLRIVSIELKENQTPSENLKNTSYHIEIKYVATLTPKQIQDILDIANTEYTLEEIYPKFVWINLKNTWL